MTERMRACSYNQIIYAPLTHFLSSSIISPTLPLWGHLGPFLILVFVTIRNLYKLFLCQIIVWLISILKGSSHIIVCLISILKVPKFIPWCRVEIELILFVKLISY